MYELILALILGLASPSATTTTTTNSDGTVVTTDCTTPPPPPADPGDSTGGDTGHYPPKIL